MISRLRETGEYPDYLDGGQNRIDVINSRQTAPKVVAEYLVKRMFLSGRHATSDGMSAFAAMGRAHHRQCSESINSKRSFASDCTPLNRANATIESRLVT
jgi:hypothetical protein